MRHFAQELSIHELLSLCNDRGYIEAIFVHELVWRSALTKTILNGDEVHRTRELAAQ